MYKPSTLADVARRIRRLGFNETRDAWVCIRDFLDDWWFPTQFKSLHAMALVESPAAFRRRGIFIDNTAFMRV